MKEEQCSAFIPGKTFCKNGFAVRVSCAGISVDHIISPCVDEKLLDNPKRSGGQLDESGKPIFMTRVQS